MYGNPVLAFVAIARLREVDWSALDEQSWFPFENVDSILIILKGVAPLIRILPDGTGEWWDGEENF